MIHIIFELLSMHILDTYKASSFLITKLYHVCGFAVNNIQFWEIIILYLDDIHSIANTYPKKIQQHNFLKCQTFIA